MTKSHGITMLGSGLIGLFYTMTLHGQRKRDQVKVIYSRDQARAQKFAKEWDIPKATTDLAQAINAAQTDCVVIGLPNHLHEEAVTLAAQAGKAVLCTKPLGRNAAEAQRMLAAVEKAGVFHGYLEDLVYTPKTLKAIQAVQQGALGEVLWVRSRETHPGPHSAWFWDEQQAGGGAMIDMGCHCVEIVRSFVGKNIKPVEVMCWADTLVHPIEAEDHGIGLIKFANGAMGQFEVSWAFRGGMDLRDEVAGTQGTIWLNHFLRTGFEMFTLPQKREGYVAEKAETDSGWLFPVGDEVHELGYVHMFAEMFEAWDKNQAPMESFYDGYVVNAILDACYKSARTKLWEPVQLEDWRGATNVEKIKAPTQEYQGHALIKRERMPDGTTKYIFKDKKTGEIRSEVK
ncbi:Gfo/Idh/MocA family oxidoreductase [candidate division KSB1 bacterium]|nr:Gfo/Idh/MocA family oxidoreductase [candidate division KSB1 bacterium]